MIRALQRAVLGQRGHLFPWVPVFFGCGIALYFLWPVEPAAFWLLLIAGAGLGILLPGLWLASGWALLAVALGALALGVATAGARAHLVAGPQLAARYYGPVEGRIVMIDRSGRSDALRLTLDRLRLERRGADSTPLRVRVALHGDPALQALVLQPAPGQRVMLTGHLMPPGGPVEPGGFDFRRHAWFQRLGAVGYTRTPVLQIAGAEGTQWLFQARMALSQRIQEKLPGEAGGFAAALMTGDRSALSRDTLDALRHTNLAHLLAISGLHMGLLAGFVFGAVRLALLCVPRSRHHWPCKKIAAVAALLAAAGYLALSGGNVATQRAFIMVAVMLVAVLADLRALSLRAVALAALIVLMMRPEALLGPGFQMSFAATTALVRVFEAGGPGRGWLPKWARPVAALVLSSATASLATAAFAMAHFNLLSRYGLLANLLAVPAMGMLVVPLAVLAALLIPLGLDGLALQGMALALRWITGLARWISGWDGAVTGIPAPGPAVLPLVVAGGLWLFLWRGRWCWLGSAPLFCGALLWAATDRPAVLISEGGGLVGVMTEQGRALSRARGSGFVAEVWLENDGQAEDQAQAAERWPSREGKLRRAEVGGHVILHVTGRQAADALQGCAGADVLVSNVPLGHRAECAVFDPPRLQRDGAVSLRPGAGNLNSQSANSPSPRLWHRTQADAGGSEPPGQAKRASSTGQ